MKERLLEMINDLEEVVTELERAEEEADGMYAECGGDMPKYPYKYGVLLAFLKVYATRLDIKIKDIKFYLTNQ